MYVAVAVGNIQWKIRFTVTKDELRCSTVAEGGMLVSKTNSVKNGLINTQEAVMLTFYW